MKTGQANVTPVRDLLWAARSTERVSTLMYTYGILPKHCIEENAYNYGIGKGEFGWCCWLFIDLRRLSEGCYVGSVLHWDIDQGSNLREFDDGPGATVRFKYRPAAAFEQRENPVCIRESGIGAIEIVLRSDSAWRLILKPEGVDPKLVELCRTLGPDDDRFHRDSRVAWRLIDAVLDFVHERPVV